MSISDRITNVLKYAQNHYRLIIIIGLIVILIGILFYLYWNSDAQEHGLKRKSDHLKKKYYQQIKNNQKNIQQTQKMGLSDEEKRWELINYYLSLKDLYYNGIPDKYDLNGAKIRGVPPNPKLAVDYITMAIENGYLRGWIDLAQMYHYGFYDFPADLDHAERIYAYIIDNVPDPAIVNEAYNLYLDANEENEKIKTHKWLNLPYTTKIQPKKTLYELGQHKTKKQQQPVQIQGFFPVVDNDINNTPVDINTVFRIGGNNPTIEVQPDPDDRVIRNDMHNVHDHSVIATIKQSIENLQKNTHNSKDNPQCLREIRQYLDALPNNDKKNDAITALDAIEKSYMPLSFTDLKETDALALVWNRIHSDVHKDNVKTLRENLADELAECIEHDKPVCATGRFTRILDTLNVVDQDVNIKPTFAINEEMMEKAGKIREDAYNHLSEKERSDVDSLAPNDFQKQWNNKLKEDIIGQLHTDYVKSDIMTQTTFDSETKKWIDEI